MNERVNLKFKVYCKETKWGDNLYIVGNTNELGNWKTDNLNESQKLNGNLYPMWLSNIISIEKKDNIKYKYIIKGPNKLKWEDCANRRLEFQYTIKRNGIYMVDDGFFGE